ncbi:hypothetical protein JCM4814A_52060 [Streptomyces phaeofaciens JCM 4814]|uniref:Uncharacterized protein n=1 Tax=Streptomyces phaeofaciens TaxID=68254 RepID=A0A918HRS6_9ACTN|nr:hypothetical protein GCM10010226_85020 [Streptomyces phaeofaciens]
MTTATRPRSGLAMVCVDMVCTFRTRIAGGVCCRVIPAHIQQTSPAAVARSHNWPGSGRYCQGYFCEGQAPWAASHWVYGAQ